MIESVGIFHLARGGGAVLLLVVLTDALCFGLYLPNNALCGEWVSEVE
jgi:hypothetical protein